MKSIKNRAWLIAPAALVLTVGCVFSPKKSDPKQEPSKYLAQSSPANCLANLQRAYEEQNLEEYVKLLSSDFEFYFSPKDHNDPDNPIPIDHWGLGDETQSTDNMFHDQLVDKITLTFQYSTADSSESDPGTWEVKMDQIHLSVFTQKDGVPWELRVNGGDATFFFKKYEGELASDGQPVWRIWKWKDQPLGLLALRALGRRTAA